MRKNCGLKIICEIGINHAGNVDAIEEMVRQASLNGADVAKFQMYDCDIVHSDGWQPKKINDFSFDQWKRMKKLCELYNLEFLSSVFDERSLERCEELRVTSHKIPSRILKEDMNLCNKIVNLGKMTYISLGMWNDSSFPFINKNVRYFNCVSKYPTSLLDKRCSRNYCDRVVGLSDHSYGLGNALLHVACGADFIEKHFTLNKMLSGNDHLGSMDPIELSQLRMFGDEIWRARESDRGLYE